MSRVKVTFRKDRKRWQVKYDLDGKRYRPLFDQKLEADNFARRIKLGLSPEDRESITIDDAGKKYFGSLPEKVHEKSKANTKRYINLHFHFMTYERGIDRLASVQLEDMEAFRDWLPKQTAYDGKPMSMGNSTVNRCLAVMKRFYKRHVQWKDIAENPCVHLEFLDADENERRAMTGDEYLSTLKSADNWFKPVLQFIYLTGAPPSVVSRLKWSDVDFQGRCYWALRRKGRKARLRRTPIAIAEQTFALLLMIRNQWPGVEGAVFRDYAGRPLLADRISRDGNDAIRAAKIEGVFLYGLRHALASDMTAANVATEIVRQVMGHASIVTTQRYANKVPLKSIAGAIETVRGGSLVANGENEQRIKEGVFKS